MPKFATRYDRQIVDFRTTQPSMTEEADYPDTLIPNIFAMHGQLPLREVQFGDFTSMPLDPAEAKARLDDAEAQFMALPSDIRARFHNSPLELISFLSREENRAEAVNLGFIDPPPTPYVSPAEPSAPADQAGGPSHT